MQCLLHDLTSADLRSGCRGLGRCANITHNIDYAHFETQMLCETLAVWKDSHLDHLSQRLKKDYFVPCTFQSSPAKGWCLSLISDDMISAKTPQSPLPTFKVKLICFLLIWSFSRKNVKHLQLLWQLYINLSNLMSFLFSFLKY